MKLQAIALAFAAALGISGAGFSAVPSILQMTPQFDVTANVPIFTATGKGTTASPGFGGAAIGGLFRLTSFTENALATEPGELLVPSADIAGGATGDAAATGGANGEYFNLSVSMSMDGGPGCFVTITASETGASCSGSNPCNYRYVVLNSNASSDLNCASQSFSSGTTLVGSYNPSGVMKPSSGNYSYVCVYMTESSGAYPYSVTLRWKLASGVGCSSYTATYQPQI